MWRALLTDGLPPCLPATMSFDSVAMSCLVTSLAIFLPSRGLRKLRKWRATFSQLSIRGRISPSALRTSVFIQSIRSSMISATVLPRSVLTALVWRNCSTSSAGSIAFSAVDLAAGILDGEGLRVIGAQHGRALLAGGGVGELEIEGRHACRDDADVEAGTFAVVDLDPLGDALLAAAVGEDDAGAACALGDVRSRDGWRW